jgi:hypothetical protein
MRKSELFIRAGRDKGKRQKGFFILFEKFLTKTVFDAKKKESARERERERKE